MRRIGVLGVVLGIALAIATSLRLQSAEAQGASAEGAWEISVAPYSAGDKPRLAVIKHNAVTGQTLILTCDNRCNPEEVWRDFAVAVAP